MRILFLAALLLSPTARASTRVISVETTTARYPSLEALGAKCSAGIPSNGHNYPTSSDLALTSISEAAPLANTRSIWMSDPANRIGDHCAALLSEVGKALPGTLTLTRTLSEETTVLYGRCVRNLVEELDGKLGNYLLVGESSFVAETLPDSECAK